MYPTILVEFGVVAFGVQFNENGCCGNVQYNFYSEIDCVHLM